MSNKCQSCELIAPWFEYAEFYLLSPLPLPLPARRNFAIILQATRREASESWMVDWHSKSTSACLAFVYKSIYFSGEFLFLSAAANSKWVIWALSICRELNGKQRGQRWTKACLRNDRWHFLPSKWQMIPRVEMRGSRRRGNWSFVLRGRK